MKNSVFALALIGAVVAHPTVKREVPQEHAHQNVLDVVNKSLKLDNPDKIQDALFGLLGAKAAAEGAGNIKDAGKCLSSEHT
jgi:N-acetylglucosamine kinase-like BadF-type ATPase